jgi:predicted RNase H-like nuclease
MTILFVGFDSAWTPTNSGALVGVLQLDDGMFNELGPPQIVDYREAERVILKWQAGSILAKDKGHHRNGRLCKSVGDTEQ